MNPLTSLLIAALVGLSLGASGTYKVVSNHYRVEAATQKEADANAYQARTLELNQVSTELEQARNDRKIVYRTITRNVQTYIDRPIYLRDAIDSDGLRDINAALAGTASTVEPAPTVPATPAAGR